MAKVTYIEHDGTTHEVDVPNGWSAMEGAITNGVPGIEAECGGACSCATCHVYVDPAWVERTGTPDGIEQGMLDCAAADLRENSRLSCQIQISDELDGLVLRLPEMQL
ncbi:MAG TPA: 2Fe-2S iron-sulfur cluster-binding protein [Gammaproteobacteria bacterium]